jgi:hypothetical protein
LGLLSFAVYGTAPKFYKRTILAGLLSFFPGVLVLLQVLRVWNWEIRGAESFFDDAQEAGAVNQVEGCFLLWKETTSDLSRIFDSLEGLLAGQIVLLN